MDGTFNKPVRAVTRLTGEDTFEVEVWDLQIGAMGQPVLFFSYTRRKS
jgi:hypothetical protein